MAVTKIHAIKKTLGTALSYIKNPEKTERELLVSAYNCSPDTAEMEFALTQRVAGERKVRGRRPANQNLAYHLIQSFSPNDPVTPEQAHELGKQLADRFLGGKHEYVIATHVDKGHIHNHVIINATSWLTGQKLRTQPYKTVAQLRAISDQICITNELSVIRQPARLPTSYKEWMERKKGASWKAELRKRLNFILDRATSYNEFLTMCKELDVAVDDSGKHITYRLRDLPQKKVVRGNKLGASGEFTQTGVEERVEENGNVKAFLHSAVLEELSQSGSWEDLLKRLERNHEIRVTEGKLGLIYHLPDGIKRKETVLGGAFSKEQLLRALEDREYVLSSEPTPSLREQWEEASVQKQKKIDLVPVRLKAEDIEKISLDGLLIRVPVNGKEASVFLDNRHLDFDAGTKTYTAYLGSEYTYYALQDNPNPDLPESDQLNQPVRGETVIRAIEKRNQVECRWVDVPEEYIRSVRPDRLILSFQKDGVPEAFFGGEDMRITATDCQVRVYDHWTYGKQFKGAELRSILEQSGGEDAADRMWRRYRAYLRKNQHRQVHVLEKVLNVMHREDVQGLNGFVRQTAELDAQIEARQSHVRILRQRKAQYAMVHRYLDAVRRHEPIWERVQQLRGAAKQKLEQSHRQELELYRTARDNLLAMNVEPTVEPEKVVGMLDNLEEELRRYDAEIQALEKRRQEVAQAEAVVREILGEERKEDSQQPERRDQKDRTGQTR